MSEVVTENCFTEALEQLDIPEELRSKLKECLKDLLSRDEKLFVRLQVNGLKTSELPLVVCFFINLGLAINKLMGSLPLIGSVICAVGKYLISCYEKMQITRELKKFISNEIFTYCKKAVSKLEICIAYCTGVFKGLSKATTAAQRDAIVRPVDRNIPIDIAADELGVLQSHIQHLTKEANIAHYYDLMRETELYCAIATLREFVLSLRIVIQPLDEGLPEVFKKQRKDAEELLSFLYKPNQENLELHLKYRNDSTPRPLLSSYLERSHLHADTLSDLDGKTFSLISANDPNIHLSLHYFLLFCMRGTSTTEGRKTHFKFQHLGSNIFAIRCSRFKKYYVSSHAWTRVDLGEPDHLRGKWLVVKIDNDGSDCFALVSEATKYNCIYVDATGRVHDKRFKPSDKRCFWKLDDPKDV